MKNIFKYTLIGFGIVAFLASCEDDDKINALQTIENAAIVTFFIENEDINLNDEMPVNFLAEAFARPDVVSYDLRVVRVSGGTVSDTLNFMSYTQDDFPLTLELGRAELASVFNLSTEEVIVNDRFEFFGSTEDTEGTVFTIENFEAGNGFIPGTSTLQFNSDGYRFDIRVVNN